jgi:hypothetical protein
MKSKDIRFLRNEWVDRPQRVFWDFTSRIIEEAGRQKEREWDFLSRPEFGITMAYRLAIGGVTCRSLKKPPYRWINKAVEYFEALGKPSNGDPELLAVRQAEDLKSEAEDCIIVQAALLARDATVERVAQRLGLPPLAVAAFSDLWFNVIDRRNEPTYIQIALEMALSHPGRIYDARHVNKSDQELLLTGLNGTLEDVLRLARLRAMSVRQRDSAASFQYR